ncbi:MAG: RagB/SusD family nutrient uptake outer membrane protein [Marinifilaceae bacterium]
MKSKIYTLLCVLALAITTGCTHLLDLEPLGSANGEQIWGTATGCRQMVAGTYAKFRKTLLTSNPFYVYGDLPSQTVLKEKEWNWVNFSSGNWSGAYNAYLDYTSNWKNFYQIITTANTLLYHIEDVKPTAFNKNEATGLKERNTLVGEAHFLYAYTYFWLVRIWNNVPLVKEAFESVDQALVDGSTVGRKQADPLEVLEYCIKRLDVAIVYLDYDVQGSATYGVRADKAAALTLKAHMLAWMASLEKDVTLQESYRRTADDCLSAVIANSGRSLVDYNNAKDVNAMFVGRSTESIFELNISADQNESFLININDTPIHCKVSWSESFNQGTGHLIVADNERSREMYDARDLRREIFFENLGNDNGDSKAPPILKKYMAGLQVDPVNPDKYFAGSNVPLLRFTDAYLLKAELQYQLGNIGEARRIVNKFRHRANLGNFLGGDDELLAEIFNERARELVGEGHSAFDRVRLNYWENCSWASADRLARNGQFWPIDIPKLFSSNRALVQTSWWQGKI